MVSGDDSSQMSHRILFTEEINQPRTIKHKQTSHAQVSLPE